MNTILKIEILKTLLAEPCKSIYELEKEIAKRNSKITVNYPTLRRYVGKLVDTKFIETEKAKRKSGKADKRGTKVLSISYKGLIYLTLKADLQEGEMVTIVTRILGKTPFNKFELTKEDSITEIPKSSIAKLINEIRPKVNLEYFDEDYVRQLVGETLIIELVLEQFKEWKKNLGDASTGELKRLRRKAKKDAKRIEQEWIDTLVEIYDYLQAKRNVMNEKIRLLKTSIRGLKLYRKI